MDHIYKFLTLLPPMLPWKGVAVVNKYEAFLSFVLGQQILLK